MAKILLILLAFTLVSCHTQKAAMGSHTLTSACPENGECALEILEGKGLKIITDDFGRTYYQLEEAPGKTVFRYKYSRNKEAGTYDAGYTEEVVFESDGDPLSLDGVNVAQCRLLFTVQCFCRGKAGTFRVQDGAIRYDRHNLRIALPNIVEGQQVTEVRAVFE